ncbi:MAG: tRNA (adenosine(37)-N6)-threonylcarbamoyltransferase complex ATPase subunit type 1 TsaE [Lachnospiraceae bacterium]|nr:tRNA (adenosine(37)-N6)-threonylcarbamoyltransferase complex ATPase subunit type 1 TsaE [Lachnospiraceae bacterium]
MDDKTVIDSFCPKDTFEFGRMMGEKIKPGTVITLSGDLGVGKTVFAKGLAKGLGITEPVVSPTFTIVQEYKEGRIPLFHFDAYRIEDSEEMYEIGFDEYLNYGGICLIEWAENINDMLPESFYKVTIEKDLEKGFDYRRITLEAVV